MSKNSSSISRHARSQKTSSRNSSIATTYEIDPDSFILTGNENVENSEPLTRPIGKFARLKYGNNEEFIFNINCQVQFLISYFLNACKTVNMERDQIDLADLSAHIKGIREKSVQNRLATEFLNPREVYILVDVKSTDIKNYYIVTPLLNNPDILTTSYLNKLQPKLPKSTKKDSNRLLNSRASIANPTGLSPKPSSTPEQPNKGIGSSVSPKPAGKGSPHEKNNTPVSNTPNTRRKTIATSSIK